MGKKEVKGGKVKGGKVKGGKVKGGLADWNSSVIGRQQKTFHLLPSHLLPGST
jgi:hypothetical protein